MKTNLIKSTLFALLIPFVVHAQTLVLAQDRAPVQDAATLGRSIPPLASFGVMQCGEVVAIWVVLQDKSVVRTDATHHPDTSAEYNAFLKWLATAQEDIYEIPCPANTVK